MRIKYKLFIDSVMPGLSGLL